MKSLPRVKSGFLRHRLEDQVLVYDSLRDRVHLLDPTTARVMELLEEGGWTPENAVVRLSERLGPSSSLELLELAVEELRTADILDEPAEDESAALDVNRRAALRKVAMASAAALLVPAITTLTAMPGYAQSGTAAACAPCSNSNQCGGGLTCTNPPQGTCGGLPIGTVCTRNSDCCSNVCSSAGGGAGVQHCN